MWKAADGMGVSGLAPESPEQKEGSACRGALESEGLTRQSSLTKDKVSRKYSSCSSLGFYPGRAYSCWRQLHASLCQIVRNHWPFLSVIFYSDCHFQQVFFFPSENTSQYEISTQSKAPAYVFLPLRMYRSPRPVQVGCAASDNCVLQASNNQRGICIPISRALTLARKA